MKGYKESFPATFYEGFAGCYAALIEYFDSLSKQITLTSQLLLAVVKVDHTAHHILLQI